MKLLKTISCLAVLSAALVSASAQTAVIDSINYVGYGYMTVSGSPDATWDVQQSPDGCTWTTVSSVTLSGGTGATDNDWDPMQFYRLYNGSVVADQTYSGPYMRVYYTNEADVDVTLTFYENDVYTGDTLVPVHYEFDFLANAPQGTVCTLTANDTDYLYVAYSSSWIAFMDTVNISVGGGDDPGFVESGEFLSPSDD